MIRDPAPFAHREITPQEHFRLHFYAAVSWLLGGLARSLGGLEEALHAFPFLQGYLDELRAQGRNPLAPGETDWWNQTLGGEAQAPVHLPLRAVRVWAGLEPAALTLWMAAGLVEEDPRFGLVFEALQGAAGQPRPTFGLLEAWGRGQGEAPRPVLLRLLELGWLGVANPEAPRLSWALQVPNLLWDAVQGQPPVSGVGLRYAPPERLTPLERLVLPEPLAAKLHGLLPLLERREVQTLVLRGPRHGGRRTLAGALARELGWGVLEVHEPPDWRLVDPLATALQALPVVVRHLGPGETLELPEHNGPWALALGQQGGVTGLGRAVTLGLTLPTPEERREHWKRALEHSDEGLGDFAEQLGGFAERYRLTGGQIRRAATLARTEAALAGESRVGLEQVRQACRSLGRQALETLAAPLPPAGDWTLLAVSDETRRQLQSLERRIRHRERLGGAAGVAFAGSLGAGVRALFSGPSGTGKTLAARLLAQSLGLDLYRLDLSRVVNKYIGETEKNLEQTLSLAEELGILLLLDEGDALLTQRTGVHSANDRYANLETNYLLQRLESFEGLLIVTTNASERMDSAFQRRMDLSIEFRLPEAAERQTIWELHLPTEHRLSPELLHTVARRCALSGGQIRNAALHAVLLALDEEGVVRDVHLEAAVRQEYRKLGQVCPLRS